MRYLQTGVGRIAVACFIGAAPGMDAWASHSNLPQEQHITANEQGFFIGGELTQVVPVEGVVKTVDASAPVDSYHVTKGGVLNIINGGVVNSVLVMESAINVSDGVVNGGIRVDHGEATIERSVIRNETGYALRLGGSGSEAIVRSSDLSGLGKAINLGVNRSLKIADSRVYGAESAENRGLGINVVGATLSVSENSHVRGQYNGINVALALDSSAIPLQHLSTIVIDSSVVEGVEGPAISVGPGEAGSDGAIADITIQNRSTLLSGNGNLLEADNLSTVNLIVDNSTLNGNLVADTTSTLNVTLQRNAQLTGNIINSDKLAINSGASWTLADSNQVNSLAMRGGRVSFGEGAHKTLTLGELSGRGTFDMRVNLDERQGDLLRVEGQASGNHDLRVKNTGVEVVDPYMQRLLLVDTDGGDAQFSLLGGRADLGVYSYELEQQGDDWFIVGSGRGISPSTQSVLALFNAAPNIWNSELNTLRSRIGEVRGHEKGGGWMRAYGSRFNASTGDGVDYRNNQSGLTLGADAPLPVSVGQLSLGLMAGYSKNDLAIGQGTSGKIGSYYVGGYGTWLLDDGYYLDAILKLNRFRNESRVAMSDGAKAKGNYESTGLGGSLEFGRNIRFADGYFLEPYAQFSSVWVKGDSYALDNGMQARNNQTQSVLAKVGASAGRSIALKDGGVVRPYLRLAAAQEFSRDNEVKVNSTRFDNDLFGSRAEVGAGVSVSLSERLQLHADFDYMKGKQVEQPWGANVGLKFAF
ncbi:autotransporter outer membrane beta-barrel domain-containing protein [Pseudomonas quasicaspiana]|uniref:autotransporter outer membrane beta-barrel domain-containing protein n=1 Tax=Pseudomonas quasicaspiana TaxID=2829821 RepID=UPI001E559B2C|nr:autotransporter outer membrane beta-barrel domain-containing protein [Pseudomonas quasicaspiana]